MSFIVGIGASAGGLDAITKFFYHMPQRDDVSFVVVQHLSPDYKSLMKELLIKFTPRKIQIAEDNMQIMDGCIYLIPPRKEILLRSDHLFLRDFSTEECLHLPINTFFQSLAEEKKENAVAVVLSGTGSDGTAGISAIKQHGGMVIAQDFLSAQFDGMPASAINTGLVDWILKPDDMGDKISSYLDGRKKSRNGGNLAKTELNEDQLIPVFGLIADEINLDLTHYKRATILRRIEHRMELSGTDTIGEYYQFLKQQPIELKRLCDDVLIGVTQFFRDQDVFQYLRQVVIPEIFLSKKEGDTVRIWTAGCSTGEEAYSIAMLIDNYQMQSGNQFPIKIFASDIDKSALETANIGLYDATIKTDIPQEFLDQYFTFSGDHYKISKKIRDMIIFSCHNVLRDAPFSHIDLLSCRNLMIYFQPMLQKKLMASFRFALDENAYLLLGPSETVGEYSSSFFSINNKYKIFKYQRIAGENKLEMKPESDTKHEFSARSSFNSGSFQDRGLTSLYRMLVHEYFSSTVVVDIENNVLLICGDANQYLNVSKGKPTNGISGYLHKKATTPVMLALKKAFEKNERSVFRYKTEMTDRQQSMIEVTVELLPAIKNFSKLAAINFRIVGNCSDERNGSLYTDVESDKDSIINGLEQDLMYSNENLQSTIEELEAANEELQAANEELLSSNEELQSTNEELQAVNEELITLNSEYQLKIGELCELNNDMDNFLSATNIGFVFLDTNLNIRKYTDTAAMIINLMPTDLGRPIAHFSHNLKETDLVAAARFVLNSSSPVEKEVLLNDGSVYLLKIYPYKTRENFIKGVTMTFVNLAGEKDEIC